MNDLRQSSQYGYYMQKIGWEVENLNSCQIFLRKIPLLPFSIIKIQRPEKIPFKKINQLAKNYRALFVKLEPSQITNYQLLITNGYSPTKTPFLPTKTLQLDLTQPESQIFSQFKKDCRYEIKKAERNHLRLLISQYPNILISDFVSLWHRNAWTRGFWLSLKKEIEALWEAFGQNAYLITASHYDNIYYHSKLLAGALMIFHQHSASYFYAALSPEGRRLSAAYLVVWEAIKLAKEKGCRIFDFEGIYDERFPNKTWLGFTHFKKSFGGEEVEYPGCFTKYYNPLLSLGSKLFNSRC